MVWGAHAPNPLPMARRPRERGRGDALGCRGPTAQHYVACAPVAQGIERLPPEQKAAGSNPAGGTSLTSTINYYHRSSIRMPVGCLPSQRVP